MPDTTAKRTNGTWATAAGTSRAGPQTQAGLTGRAGREMRLASGVLSSGIRARPRAFGRSLPGVVHVLGTLQWLRSISSYAVLASAGHEETLPAGSTRLFRAVECRTTSLQKESGLVFVENVHPIAKPTRFLQRHCRLAQPPLIATGAGKGHHGRVPHLQNGLPGFDLMPASQGRGRWPDAHASQPCAAPDRVLEPRHGGSCPAREIPTFPVAWRPRIVLRQAADLPRNPRCQNLPRLTSVHGRRNL